MKPAAIEDTRFAQNDYCPTRLEEQVMFEYLDTIAKNYPGRQLLDLGCGSGLISKQLQERGWQVRGLDFSSVAVAKAQANSIDAAVADIDEGLPEPADQYDVVVAGDVLEHVFDPLAAIGEVARVLKPGGYFLVTVPNDVSVMVRLKTLLGISYQEVMYRRSGVYKHHTFFTVGLLSYLLKRHRFTVEKTARITNIGHRWQVKSAASPLLFTNELAVKARLSPN
jgi:2-polyprenyl-3-methyl-5-hydroxy-6-metoxy-1,4-benzoquinol methylase